jgi:hypothetical protein
LQFPFPVGSKKREGAIFPLFYFLFIYIGKTELYIYYIYIYTTT